MSSEPIFIVGVQRSGTTLLAAMLAAHPHISCGPETHFFRWLDKIDPDTIIDPIKWPENALDFIVSITRKSFSTDENNRLIDLYRLSQEEIRAYLAQHSASIASILGSLTENFMHRAGKVRWVEKTPDHIKYLELIRSYFPKSPIIRMLRDPRDVSVSLTKVPWGARTFVDGLLYWHDHDDMSRDFFDSDPLTISIKFEDLILTPKNELQRLCDFIGEPFEAGMLDTSSTGRMVNSRNVPWKDMASKPIDTSRISVWQKELAPGEKLLAEALLGDRLLAYGYPVEGSFPLYGEIYPTNTTHSKYIKPLEYVASRGVRFWRCESNELPQASVFIGEPSYGDWVKRDSNILSKTNQELFFYILKKKLAKLQLYWIPEPASEKWTGFWSYLHRVLLNPYKITID